MVVNHDAHGPHRAGDAAASRWEGASPLGAHGTRLEPESHEAEELLASLDDAMFTTISGDSRSLGEAQRLWQCAAAALPEELVEESREQYLRFAVEVTRRTEAGGGRDPSHAILALEVIALLAS